jgi:hypothetical protein
VEYASLFHKSFQDQRGFQLRKKQSVSSFRNIRSGTGTGEFLKFGKETPPTTALSVFGPPAFTAPQLSFPLIPFPQEHMERHPYAAPTVCSVTRMQRRPYPESK